MKITAGQYSGQVVKITDLGGAYIKFEGLSDCYFNKGDVLVTWPEVQLCAIVVGLYGSRLFHWTCLHPHVCKLQHLHTILSTRLAPLSLGSFQKQTSFDMKKEYLISPTFSAR